MVIFYKKNRFFDKILYRPSSGPIGTWFWSFRSIENGFPIQMVQVSWILELGNDVSWRNNVWHKFFLYKACFGPYRTLFWPYHSIEKLFSDSIHLIYILISQNKWCFVTRQHVCCDIHIWISIYGYPYGYPYGYQQAFVSDLARFQKMPWIMKKIIRILEKI